MRGQSNPELKKYLWVVIRTQKERKLQTLIEVCTDFSSLRVSAYTYRPVEQTFAVHLALKRTANQRPCLLGCSSPMDRPRSFGTIRFTYIAADVRAGLSDGVPGMGYVVSPIA